MLLYSVLCCVDVSNSYVAQPALLCFACCFQQLGVTQPMQLRAFGKSTIASLFLLQFC